MEFGWINGYQLIIVTLILLPNMIFAKTCDYSNDGIPKVVLFFENIGRYAAMALMIFPVFVWKFGYSSVAEMMISILCNAVLVVAYNVVWILYARKKSAKKAFALAILPAMIFFVSGVTLGHWALVITAIVFGVCHIYITNKNTGET